MTCCSCDNIGTGGCSPHNTNENKAFGAKGFSLFQVSITGIYVVGFHFELFSDSIMLTVCNELIRGVAPASSFISISHLSLVCVLLRPPRWWLDWTE